VHRNRPDNDEQRQPRLLFRWRRALTDSDLSRELRATARALSDYMDMDGGGAYPSQRLLAHDVGVHFQTVKRHLRKLRAKGWFVIIRAGHGPGQSNHYQATIPEEGSVGAPYSGDEKGARASRKGSAGVAKRERNSDPLPPKTSHRSPNGSRRKKELAPDDVRGFFDVVREQVGIELEPNRVLVDEVRARVARGYTARHVGGEVDARTWPAELDSPEGLAIHRLRKLGGAA
jgi:Helix-turn-helix domain